MSSTYPKPSAKLTRTLTQDKLEHFERVYQNAHVVIERILEVLSKEMDSLNKDMDSPLRFENPNWAEQTAHNAGQRKAVRDLIKLLDAKGK